jgi:hypothetical protein
MVKAKLLGGPMKATFALACTSSVLVVSFSATLARAQQTRQLERMAPARSVEDSLKQGIIRVSAATLTPLSASTGATRALLAVQFNPQRPPGSSVALRPDGKTIVLRDDGQLGDVRANDRIFSAIVEVSQAEIAAEQKTAATLLQTRRLERFSGRVQLPALPIPPEAFQDLRRPLLQRPIPFIPIAFADPLLKDRSLMITDPSVIQDPTRTYDVCSKTGTKMGKWTFGYLMTQMANQAATSHTTASFVLDWLHQWEVPQTVNSFTIPARTGITATIITPWPRERVITWLPWPTRLNLAEAPFRLLAIVNRVDLRQNLIYGGGSAGEARFVFEAIDRRPSSNGTAKCVSLPFTVIFEYGIHKNSCSEVKAWAKQWYDLRPMAPSSGEYRAALEAITEQFVRAGANPSQLPNQNALSQLRTNERAIGVPWELREFHLAGTGFLASTTTKQEPDNSYHDGNPLVDWINANAASVAAGTHKVPDLLPATGKPLLAAHAPIPNDNLSFIWGRGHDIATPNARQQFSLATCSGCHTGETKTQFTHVKPAVSRPPTLSGFLTGISVVDPDPSDADNSTRVYNDLERRALDLDGLVNSICLRQLVFNNISRMTH